MVKDACSPFNIATDWKQFAKAHKERKRAVLSPFQPTALWLWRTSTICSSALCFGCEQYQNAAESKREKERDTSNMMLCSDFTYAVAPHNGARTHTHACEHGTCVSRKSVFSFPRIFKFKHNGGRAFCIFTRQLDVRRTKEISVASCFLN